MKPEISGVSFEQVLTLFAFRFSLFRESELLSYLVLEMGQVLGYMI